MKTEYENQESWNELCILGFGERDSVMSMEWTKNGSRKSYLYIINIIIVTST